MLPNLIERSVVAMAQRKTAGGKRDSWEELQSGTRRLGGNGYFHYLNYGEGFSSICIRKSIKLDTKCAIYCYQLYLGKAFLKNPTIKFVYTKD